MVDCTPMTQLDAFQYEAMDFLDTACGRAVIADPMGARKTGTILSWLSHTPCGRTLIVAPSGVHTHWQREAERFYPEASVHQGSGTQVSRAAALLRSTYADASEPSLYVTTFESHVRDADALHASHFDTVVYDEAHRLKGRTTQVAKASNLFARSCKYVVCATGTPVINRPHELWQYLHMLAPRKYTSFWKWVEQHWDITYARYQGRMGPETKVIGDYLPGHEELVRAEIAPFMLQRDLAELFPGEAWIEEPEHTAIEVPLSPKERKLYDNLVKHEWGITESGQEIVTAGIALQTRLAQISSDWGALDGTLEYGAKSVAAIDLIADLVEKDGSVVVFAKYHETVQRIAIALHNRHIPTSMYHGGMSPDHRDDASNDFRTGRTKVIVGTLDSLSEGVDGLQRCHTIVMVDRHWTAAKNDQAIGRCRRSGQSQRVNVWHLYAEGTLDYSVVEACLTKTNVVQVLKNKPLIDAIYGK